MNFFEEFFRLQQQVPRPGLQVVQNENSPYCQYTEKSKNCYMTFASYQSEDCMYNTRVFYCRDCTDCTFCYKCELCFQCLDCIQSYNCNFSTYCENAIDSDHCFYCVGVQNCFGCVGLIKTQYHIFNKPYSKEEYLRQLPELRKLSLQEIQARLEPLLTTVPRVAMYGKNNESAYGENIHQCKDVYWGFDSKKLRDCFYVYHCDESKDLFDCSHLGWSELCYEIMSGGNLNNCQFCYGSWFSSNLEYCELVYSSHDCFGCIALNHAEYAILNQRYAKDEYFRRVAAIKQEMKQSGTYGKWFSTTYPEVLTYGL